MPRSPLVEALIAEQAKEGISDYRLAHKLGVALSTVSRLKSGQRQGDVQTQRAILRVYPQLLGYVLPTEDHRATEREGEDAPVAQAHGPPRPA